MKLLETLIVQDTAKSFQLIFVLNAAISNFEQHLFKNAIEKFTQVLKFENISNELNNLTKRYLIESYLMLNEHDKAVKYFEEFNNLNENSKKICSILIMVKKDADFQNAFKM